MRVSILIPVYNEASTIREIVDRVQEAPYQKEIIVVDDGSRDGTREILGGLPLFRTSDNKFLSHDRNRGKGAALQTAFKVATGDVILIQDADLETGPEDYSALLEPIIGGRADVVYGSRFLNNENLKGSRTHYWGNRFLTGLTNLLFSLRLTDMETCHKVFIREVLEGLVIRSSRFGFEPEFTAKVAKRAFRICEVPIHYYPRSRSEGKKIKWVDGVRAVFTLLWFRLTD
ncbi:MAG: glycosyltransferase family 2 protein [Desulfobacteraceae bacterium]|nr:MAG: glycosyltransferase family 2 protein [Desulfobacteraceae bacterium]